MIPYHQKMFPSFRYIPMVFSQCSHDIPRLFASHSKSHFMTHHNHPPKMSMQMEWADGCTHYAGCTTHLTLACTPNRSLRGIMGNHLPIPQYITSLQGLVHRWPFGSWVAVGSLWPTFTSILTFTHRHQSLQGEFQGPDPTQKAYLLLVHAMVQSELESQSKIFLWKSWLTGRPRDQASPRLSGRILVIGNRFWGSHSCTFVGLSQVACVVVCQFHFGRF